MLDEEFKKIVGRNRSDRRCDRCRRIVSYKITKKLVAIALDRGEENTIDADTGKEPESPEIQYFMVKRERAARELEKKECEKVEIIAHDGIHLVGHWWKCDDARRVIIAMHGWRSSWTRDFGLIADFFMKINAMSCLLNREGRTTAEGNIWDSV